MYLSDRDIAEAIDSGRLIFSPPPAKIDATSVDLQLDDIKTAKIWDVQGYVEHQKSAGMTRPELRIAKYNLYAFSQRYLISPPEYDESPDQLVGVRGGQVVVKPRGFLLWQTVEVVGTPAENADLICFIDDKSTRTRAGILVHLTAPTIHASWKGHVTLEIANLGPFDLVLAPGDVIAQLTVAQITNPPEKGVQGTSVTYDQAAVNGTKGVRRRKRPKP